jgi:hypothetical protein
VKYKGDLSAALISIIHRCGTPEGRKVVKGNVGGEMSRRRCYVRWLEGKHK